MREEKRLTDNEVHDRLVAAVRALGTAEGDTTRGNSALEAARQMIGLLQFGLVAAMERAEPTDR